MVGLWQYLLIPARQERIFGKPAPASQRLQARPQRPYHGLVGLAFKQLLKMVQQDQLEQPETLATAQ
jgi:hypothetical protein